MILEILKYPDVRLRETSKPVIEFNSELKKLAGDMLETMYAEKGIGLAAPQVGRLFQMLVIDARPREEKARYDVEDLTDLEKLVQQPLVMINPRITLKKGKQTFDEGCLSVPSFFETVERADYVEVEYQDLEGAKQILKTDGLLSIVVQHEMDHLDGTLFIDRISFVKSNKIKNSIKKFGYPEKVAEKDKNKEEM